MELLDEAMEQLADAKNSMMCESCQGEGCSMCQGGMSGLMAMGRSRNQGGMGMGDGRGVGDRPEAKTNKNFYDSKVRANASKARAVVTGLAQRPQCIRRSAGGNQSGDPSGRVRIGRPPQRQPSSQRRARSRPRLLRKTKWRGRLDRLGHGFYSLEADFAGLQTPHDSVGTTLGANRPSLDP